MQVRITALAAAMLFATVARADLAAGNRAVDFEKRALNGQTVKLSGLRGKVVLVDFWASWCEPCKRELPLLAKMAPRLKAKGIEIVAVNIDDNPKNATDFLAAHGLKDLTVVADADKTIVGKYEPATMPSSFVVDKAGVVRAVNAGFNDGDERKIEQQLSSLAAK
jgi:thiol-disulfide isomerase/thioredoxin